jgi:hypothetical protein
MSWVNITGTKIQDASGNLLAHGEISFQPTDGKGNPIPALAASGGLMIEASSAAITTGVIDSGYHVSPSSTSAPTNLNYTVTITDTTTGTNVVLVNVVVPDGGINFDAWDPSMNLPAIPQVLVSPVVGTSPLPSGTTATTNGVDDNTAKVATDAFVLAQAASANPLVDGSVSAGTSTRFARADHVHPIISASALTTGNLPIAQIPTGGSSTTFLRGDNAWGTPSGAGNVTGPGSSVTGDYAVFSNTTGEVLADGGQPTMRNRIINGDMRINQRNSGASQTITAGAALAYTVDRFYAYCTGANVTGQQVAGSASSQYRYQFTGAASVTAIGFATRLEANNTYDLNNTSAIFSVDLANSLLTSVTWKAYYATTADTFGTLASPTKTQIATGTFTVSSALARYSASINVPSAATTGIEVVFSVGAQTSGTWTIGNVQLEAGTVATPFERRPYGLELMLCKRYLPLWTGTGADDSLGSGQAASGGQAFVDFIFDVVPRVPPTGVATTTLSTLSLWNAAAGDVAVTGLGIHIAGYRSVSLQVLVTSGLVAGNATKLVQAGSTPAQIYFTGCEL